MNAFEALRLISYLAVILAGGYSVLMLSGALLWSGGAFPISRSLALICVGLVLWAVEFLMVEILNTEQAEISWRIQLVFTLPIMVLATSAVTVAWILRKRKIYMRFQSSKIPWSEGNGRKYPLFTWRDAEGLLKGVLAGVALWAVTQFLTAQLGNAPLFDLLTILVAVVVAYMSRREGYDPKRK